MSVNVKQKKEKKATGAGRWSAVDTVIVLLLLIAVAAQLWQAILIRRETDAEKTPTAYDVTFSVSAIRREVLEGIDAFDGLYLCEDGTRIGSVGVYEDEDGSQRIALSVVEPGPDGLAGSEYVAAEGCMICTEGEYRDGGLLIPDTGLYLDPGSEWTVRTDRVMLTIRIESIRTHE